MQNGVSTFIRKENQSSETKEVTSMTKFRHIGMSKVYRKQGFKQLLGEWLRNKGSLRPRRICFWQDLNEWLTNKGSFQPKTICSRQDLNEWLTNKGSLRPRRICFWQDLNEWLTNKGSLRPKWLHMSICLLFELNSYEFPIFLIGWSE